MIERSRETPAEHRSGEPVETKLLRIAARARGEPKLKFKQSRSTGWRLACKLQFVRMRMRPSMSYCHSVTVPKKLFG